MENSKKIKCVLCLRKCSPLGQHTTRSKESKENDDQIGDTDEDARYKHQKQINFLLRKILLISEDNCRSILQRFGDPLSLIQCCDSCSELLGEAQNLFHHIIQQQNRFKELQHQMKITIAQSVKYAKRAVTDPVTSAVRSCFKNEEPSNLNVARKHNSFQKRLDETPKVSQHLTQSPVVLVNKSKMDEVEVGQINQPPKNATGDQNFEKLSDNQISKESVPSAVTTFQGHSNIRKDMEAGGPTTNATELKNSATPKPATSELSLESDLGEPDTDCDAVENSTNDTLVEVKNTEKPTPQTRAKRVRVRNTEKPVPKKRSLVGIQNTEKTVTRKRSKKIKSELIEHEKLEKRTGPTKWVFNVETGILEEKYVDEDSMEQIRPKGDVKNAENKDSSFLGLTGQIQLKVTDLPFKCKICGACFALAADLESHKIGHDQQENDEKLNASAGLATKVNEMGVPVECVNGVGGYKCNICGKTFVLEDVLKLKRHLQYCSGKRGRQCHICGKKGFEGPHKLAVHVRVHTGEKPYMCDICGICFAQHTGLKRHEETHIGEFSCGTCTRRFANQDSLDIHMRRHTGEKPLCCDKCDKSYAHPITLSRHKKNCEGKPIECPICGRPFSLERNLLIHVETHKGESEKTHVCQVCDKRFPTSTHLRIHSEYHKRSLKYDNEISEIQEKAFSCEYCDKRYARKNYLERHIIGVHKGEKSKPFKCHLCGKCYASNFQLRIHKKTHWPERNKFQCDACGNNFFYASLLKNHQKEFNHPENSHKCHYCEKTFPKNYSLQIHLRIHTGEGSFVCSTCDKEFPTKSRLNSHRETHLELKTFQCEVCSSGFTTRPRLRFHLLNHHRVGKSYECKLCQKVVNSAANLYSHMRHSHTKPRFECQTCGKGFHRPDHLAVHENVHKKRKPYRCDKDDCLKSFSSKAALKTHQAIHTGQIKTYSCETCGKCFSQTCDLQEHHRKYKHGKSYVCKYCRKSFLSAASLNGHLKVHAGTGNKRYQCNICDKSFTQSHTLKSHMKKHRE